MRISKEGRRIAREMLEASRVDGFVDAARAKAAADLVIRERPRGTSQILKEFLRLVRLELDKRRAVIESAVPLGEKESKKIIENLRERAGGEVLAEFKVSSRLLGGVRIQLGSDVWDGSVARRLQILKQAF